MTYVSGLTFPLLGPFRSFNDAVRVHREDARQLARLPLEPRSSTNPLSVVVRLEQRNREVATRASGLRRSLRRHQAASRCLCLVGEGGWSDSEPQKKNEGRGIVVKSWGQRRWFIDYRGESPCVPKDGHIPRVSDRFQSVQEV